MNIIIILFIQERILKLYKNWISHHIYNIFESSVVITLASDDKAFRLKNRSFWSGYSFEHSLIDTVNRKENHQLVRNVCKSNTMLISLMVLKGEM